MLTRLLTLALALPLFAAGLFAQLINSGPISVMNQNGAIIENLHITSTTGDCILVGYSQNVIIRNSEIGPCGTSVANDFGNGIHAFNSSGLQIVDNYIHPETQATLCCDNHDGIHLDTVMNSIVQGNVIAYGEANFEATGSNYGITLAGNFFLNPRGPADPRGQNIQFYSSDFAVKSQKLTVINNYTLASTSGTYLYPENQEDSINFGGADNALVMNNYVTGGHSRSGCGIIADYQSTNLRFLNNSLLNTGQCGIGMASGQNNVADGNKIYNTTPVVGGGNTAMYVFRQYQAPSTNVTLSNNIADAFDPGTGIHNPLFDARNVFCTIFTNNTFGAAADSQLTPTATVFPPPLIPPTPKACIATSPYTNNTTLASGFPLCSSISLPIKVLQHTSVGMGVSPTQDAFISFPNPVKAGSLVVVATATYVGSTQNAPFDSAGNTYTLAVSNVPPITGDPSQAAIYYGHVTNPGTLTVYANNTGFNHQIVHIYEVQGVTTLDQTGSNYITPGNTAATVSTAGATATANEYALAFFSQDNVSGTWTPGSGWGNTEYTNAAGSGNFSEDKLLNATGTVTATATSSTVDFITGVIATFR